MNRKRRSSSIRLISLAVCYALVVATVFLPFSPSVDGARGAGVAMSHYSMKTTGLPAIPSRLLASLLNFFQGGGLPNVPGPGLPDLDAARVLQPSDPVAPAAIPSNQSCAQCAPCPTCGPGIANHAPVVKAGGPYYGIIGAPIEVNGLGSFDADPADGISVYSWTLGDGSGTFNGAMPSHTYQSAGNYTISLTVTDYHNTTATVSTTASITATPASVPPSGTTQGNAAQFIAQSVPTTMTGGGSYQVSVTMRNLDRALYDNCFDRGANSLPPGVTD